MAEVSISDRWRKNYDDYYRSGESEWRRLGAEGKARNITDLCRSSPHSTVLDIGAGDGAVLQRLSELGFGDRYWALEISSSGVDVIRGRQINGLQECRRFDGYRIPYGDHSFDLAILSHVVEHVEHPRVLLEEASRVSRHLFVEVPLEDTLRLPLDFRPDRVGHINFYSPRTIRRLLQTCGIEVLEQRVTNPAKAAYVHRLGRRGAIRYYVKQGLLRCFPRLATEIFTYHCALVGRVRQARKGTE